MVWKEEVGCQIEGITYFSPNVVSFLLMTDLQRWYVFGLYVTPNDAPTIYCVEQVM